MKNVIVALGTVAWEAEFVGAVSHPMMGVRVQRRCVDALDIRSAIQVMHVDVVVVSDATLRVDEDLLVDLRESGVRLVAISSKVAMWIERGADHVIDFTSHNPIRAVGEFSEWLRRGVDDEKTIEATPTGRLVAVMGFGGSAGRSTCAREVGWQLGESRFRTVIVDGDSYGPSLHQELGMQPNVPSLVQLAHECETRRTNTINLSSHVTQWTVDIDFLAGVDRSSQWLELRTSTLRHMWKLLMDHYDRVVVDLGPVIERDLYSQHEVALPQRHSIPMTALELSNTVILCARHDEVGVTRLVKGYLEFSEVLADKNIIVNLWGVNGSANNGAKAVTRLTGLRDIFTTPFDHKVVTQAAKSHLSISETAKKNAVTETFRAIANSLDTQTSASRTKSRLAKLMSHSLDHEAA